MAFCGLGRFELECSGGGNGLFYRTLRICDAASVSEFILDVNGVRIIHLLDGRIPRGAGDAGLAGAPWALPDGLRDGFRGGRRAGIGKNDKSLILSGI